MEDKQLYTVKDLMKIIGVSRDWFDRKINSGKIKVVRFGGTIRIRKDEVERIMKEGVE